VLQIFWQIRQVDKTSGSSNGCTGDDILKLPHIARPGVLLDAYEWVLFLTAHSERHLKQIQEVKSDPNFPKA
jgi:hypothetical protein